MAPSAQHRAFMPARWTALLCVIAAAAPACKENGTATPPDKRDRPADAGTAPPPENGGKGEQAAQWYRAWVVGGPEVGDVPFFLRLPARPERGTAVMANGTQHIEAEARWYGAEVSVNQPLLRTRMFLRQDEQGVLKGHLMSRSPVADGTASLPLEAVPVPEPDDSRRFLDVASCGPPAEATGEGGAPAPGQPSDQAGGATTGKAGDKTDKAVDKGSGGASAPAAGGPAAEPWGRWLASFDTGAVELVLEQPRPGVASGSFTFGDGTVAVLFGNVFGSRICLSGFDGVNSFLGVLDLEPGGATLRGRWASGPGLERRLVFTAERREQVDVVTNSILFAPNRTKVSLFELGLPQYRGKPVIIEFGASWCPPCLDSAPVLRELYDRHHAQGLEIVTLLFELLDDEDALRRQAKLFVEAHGIPWQVIPVRGEIKPYWDIVPHDPDVAEVNLPVTIFINADGTIRDAHTGFPGPESGKPYQTMVERYQRVAAELVSQKK